MYIWVAADVDGQLGTIREKIEKICSNGNMANSALTLPLHISLKISCEIEDALFLGAVDKISEYFSTLSPFTIRTGKAEINGNILWIKIADSDKLCRIHEDLDNLFESGYGIARHPFDREFIFHTTLFYGEGAGSGIVGEAIKNERLPEVLLIDKFIIGCSESGKAGEYRVIKEISVCEEK